jgi:hypothetical protein
MRSLWYWLKNINITASFVGKDMNLLGKRKQDSVHKNVQAKHYGRRERVYNLTVDKDNEYFANNILVHNCDSLSIFIHLAGRASYVPASLTIAKHTGHSTYNDQFKEIWSMMGLE